MTHLIAALAEPYSNAELAEFEQLIFASSNDDHAVRLLARAVLASFLREHGKAKCDLMMERLTRAHEAAANDSTCTDPRGLSSIVAGADKKRRD